MIELCELSAAFGLCFVLAEALLTWRDDRRRTTFGRWHGEPDVSLAMDVRLMVHGPAARAVVIEAERTGMEVADLLGRRIARSLDAVLDDISPDVRTDADMAVVASRKSSHPRRRDVGRMN